METLGSLVDKLSIANIRLWHLEDARRDKTKSDKDRLKAADTVASVNSERNMLIDEIDVLFDKAIKDGTAPRNPKNKLY